MIYCTSCGAQNVEGARFCNYCGSPLELKAAAAPAAAAPPSQPPYAPAQAPFPPPQWARGRRAEEECLGQTRIPGLVILALIILLVAIFSLIQWFVERTYGTTATGFIWPFFGIAVALLLIGVWMIARTPPTR